MNKLDTLINSFARKVDSLNWQSTTYQKEAKKIHKQQLKKLMHELLDTDHDTAHKIVDEF